MVVLDTSVLVGSLAGAGRSSAALRGAISRGLRLEVPSLVLYEWRRGPRVNEELEAQEVLFPSRSAIAFGSEEAAIAAELYRSTKRARGRELDLAIAACALAREARLWTLNPSDFVDLPGLELYDPGSPEPAT